MRDTGTTAGLTGLARISTRLFAFALFATTAAGAEGWQRYGGDGGGSRFKLSRWRRCLRNNILQKQAKFDDFIDGYNTGRPYQALAMPYPLEHYRF
jgi:hypothetical protein